MWKKRSPALTSRKTTNIYEIAEVVIVNDLTEVSHLFNQSFYQIYQILAIKFIR